jgi:hypothetical protein
MYNIRFLTVGELLDGKQIDYPHLTGGNVTHRRAPRELKAADQRPELRTRSGRRVVREPGRRRVVQLRVG